MKLSEMQLLRQISLLPAGASMQSREVLYSDSKRIIYASTLALYIINANTFIIEKVISIIDRNFSSFTVSPHDKDQIIVASCDGLVRLWKLSDESNEFTINSGFTHASIMVAWDVHSPDHCAIIASDPYIRVLMWDISKGIKGVVELFSIRSNATAVVARWNPHLQDMLAIGLKNSHVHICNLKEKKTKLLKVDSRDTPVVDIQWDRLSSVYLLVAYKTFISLWDTENLTEIHTFERQPSITSIAWMDWTAGNFLSCSDKSGIIKIWNVSQQHCLSTVRICNSGIKCCYFGLGIKRGLFACTDGSIIVYDIDKRYLEFSTSAGHTDTIFSCEFSPQSPDTFVTTSFDQSIKTWSVSNMQLMRSIETKDGIIYSIHHSPSGDKLVTASQSGAVCVWDAVTGHLISRYVHHTKTVYDVAWNHRDPTVLASASGDCKLCIFIFSPEKSSSSSNKKHGNSTQRLDKAEVIVNFTHPTAIFGCSWCTHECNYISTGSQDGVVRIFDYKSKSQKYLLYGHSARSFQTIWSPIIAGRLATGSDDKTILIWDIDLSLEKTANECSIVGTNDSGSSNVLKVVAVIAEVAPTVRLIGHTANVRALEWNSEHKKILISGAWDHSIRVWNVETGVCLNTINCHVADVYSTVSHPLRPFTLLSVSRDSTVRLWEHEGLFTSLRVKAVWHKSMDSMIDTFENRSLLEDGTDDKDAVTFNTYSQNELLPLLSGAASASLNKLLNESKSVASTDDIAADRLLLSLHKAKLYSRIYNYFTGSNGCLEVWELLITILNTRVADLAQQYRHSSSSNNSKSVINTLNTSVVPPTNSCYYRMDEARIVQHEGALLLKARSEARKNESMHMLQRRGDMSTKAQEKLRNAAMLYAKVNDFQKCCSILIELNDWTSAISLAPNVSLEYWRLLSAQYATHLSNLSNELCVPHMIAIADDSQAIDFYVKRNDCENAMLIAKMSEARDIDSSAVAAAVGMPLSSSNSGSDTDLSRYSGVIKGVSNVRLQPIGTATATTTTTTTTATATAQADTVTKRQTVISVAVSAAQHSLKVGQPFIAAARMIAIEDFVGSVKILSACGEYDSAYAICDCLDIDHHDVLLLMADNLAKGGDVDTALQMLCSLKVHRDREIGLLLTRYCQHETDKANKFMSIHSKSASQWYNKAKEEEEIGSDVGATLAYIVSRNHKKAVELGVNYLKKYVREPIESISDTSDVLRYLKYVNVSDIDNDSVKITYMTYMLWFGAHEAVLMHGMWETSCVIFKLLRKLLSQCTTTFQFSCVDIYYQELFVRILHGDPSVPTVFTELAALHSDAPEAINDGMRNLKALVEAFTSSSVRMGTGGSAEANTAAASSLASILREMQRLSDALSLPSMNKLFNKKGNINATFTAAAYQPVRNGSLLPSFKGNRSLSIFSEQPVSGAAVTVDAESESVASVNELFNWSTIIPNFLPIDIL